MLKSLLLAPLLLIAVTTAQASSARHAIAMHGTPKYDASFRHFDYVNPDAPKGGTLRRHVIGTFDSFNPYIPKGNAAAGTGYI